MVIPTWNGLRVLRGALESLRLQEFADFEVIVVDNGSTDDTVACLATEYPEVRVVALSTNQGFAPAVNRGVEAARGELLVLMNNDTVAEPGWLGALVRAMDRHPEAGACASKMLVAADPRRIDSAGDRLGLFASAIGHGELDGPRFDAPRWVLSACAGAAAYRRDALRAVGPFDERFFAYFEDVDLGIRLQFAGYRCLYVPDAVIHHLGSATARKLPALKFYLAMRNSLYVFFQYMPLRRLIPWGPAVLLWPLVRAAIDRHPPTLGARAVGAFLMDLPEVWRRRRAVVSGRRISWAEFRSLLAPPLTRQGTLPRGAPAARTAQGTAA